MLIKQIKFYPNFFHSKGQILGSNGCQKATKTMFINLQMALFKSFVNIGRNGFVKSTPGQA
jgi:hypothetical protein